MPMAGVASSAAPLPTLRGHGPEISKQPQSLRRMYCSSGPNQPPISATVPPAGRRCHPKFTRIFASVSYTPKEELRTAPDDLVDTILSKVTQTDRGVLLTSDEHKKVAELAQELQKFCVDEPVNCPLIFGEWDVVYCSVPTSPGGLFRSEFGRLIFKTRDMIQVVEAPDRVKNKVSFRAFGFFDGEVSLEGKLKALDEKWIQVVFEPPKLTIGALDYEYGGQSEVKLEITYVDEKIRLGKGSRGSLFVFQRR